MIIEQNMKYYIIEDTTAMISSYNSHILVKANNKKEALDKMWVILGYDNQKNDISMGYKPHYKNEFNVIELNQWFEKIKYTNCDVAIIH